MTRDARFYFLINKDWEPIKKAIDSKIDYFNQAIDIAVFRISKLKDIHRYAILSVSEEIDTIIENCGGELNDKDLIINALKKGNHNFELIYGADNLVAFLNV